MTQAGGHAIPEYQIGIGLCILLAPLVIIKDISIFASCHIVADIIIILAAIYIEGYAIGKIIYTGIHPSVVPFTSILKAMQVIGICTGAFEISPLIITVYMQAREKRLFATIQFVTMLCVSVLYLTFGTFGYFAFGENVKGPVTLSLDAMKYSVDILILLYILALMPTILIQLFPAIQIIETNSTRFLDNENVIETLRIFIRLFLLIAAIWIAVAFGENYDKVLSLIGNIACAPLSYIFPGIFHLVIVARTRSEKARDIILISFGSFCFLIATILIIIGWV